METYHYSFVLTIEWYIYLVLNLFSQNIIKITKIKLKKITGHCFCIVCFSYRSFVFCLLFFPPHTNIQSWRFSKIKGSKMIFYCYVKIKQVGRFAISCTYCYDDHETLYTCMQTLNVQMLILPIINCSV